MINRGASRIISWLFSTDQINGGVVGGVVGGSVGVLLVIIIIIIVVIVTYQAHEKVSYF